MAGSSFGQVAGGGHVPLAGRRGEVTAAFQGFVSGLLSK